jgi:hypothetical protein
MAQAKKKTKPTFDEMLNNASAPAPKKSGRVVKEIITDAPKAVKEGISKVLKAKATKKAAESEIKIGETPVIEFGQTVKDKRAFDGDYNKSYKVQGLTDDEVITFVTANKFSYKPEDEAEVKNLMGEEDFDEMIPEGFQITVKEEVFADPKMQKFMMDKFGKRFAEFFEVTKTRKVIPTFDEKLYRKYDQETIDDIKVYVKQAKPSIK